MSDIVLVDGARTPHGTLLGSLAEASAVELGRVAVDAAVERAGVDPSAVEWVALGNAIQAGIGQVPARQVVVESALPPTVAATTVNEASGSGLRSIALAADRIAAGEVSIAVAGGFESMTNAPWVLPGYRTGKRHGDVTLQDSMVLDALWDRSLDVHMGEIAERLVDRAGDEIDCSREAQDRYALESNKRAAEAIESGAFDPEIAPVDAGDEVVERDEGPRPDSTLAELGALSPSFRTDGTITPANASKLADGAGAVVLAEAEVAAAAGLDPSLQLVDYAVTYRRPDEFNEAVADVVATLLDANGLSIDEIGTFWINEAFAAQSRYVMERVGIPRDRMNPRGGAVAFGHPIGASGGMLAVSLANEMADEDHEYGVLGMSIGGGGAIMSLWRR